MSNLDKALSDFKAGRFVIVTDDENRENEADLILLAEQATPEKIGFMVRYTSGVICAVLDADAAKRLKLPLMVARNEDNHTTAFTVTVDVNEGRTTGISALERANTLRALASPAAKPTDFSRPGHVFPLIAVEGGLTKRRGHTEAGMALCTLTNSNPTAVLSELVNDDGTMMRGVQIGEFAREHDLEIISIDQLAKALPTYLSVPEAPLEWAQLPLTRNSWEISTYVSPTGTDQAILKFGDIEGKPLLLRIHSECLTGDIFGSQRCDCGSQLSQSITLIEENGSGAIIYLRDHEGRGIGLTEKIRAYILQEQGQDTVEANISLGHPIDDRSYDDVIVILRKLNVSSVELITNNPAKTQALKSAGLSVGIRPINTAINRFNKKYLETKRELLGHAIGEI